MARYVAVALVCCVVGSRVAAAADDRRPVQAPEYQLKGAYLFSFIRFVEWPSSAAAAARAPLRLCVLGESPIGVMVESLARTPVKGRQLVVRRLDAIAQVPGCEVLFVSRRAGSDLDAMLRAVPAAVLTVSEIDTDERVGSVLNLVVEPDRVAFDVNRDAARQARLVISSRLLSVARAVDGRRRRQD